MAKYNLVENGVAYNASVKRPKVLPCIYCRVVFRVTQDTSLLDPACEVCEPLPGYPECADYASGY